MTPGRKPHLTPEQATEAIEMYDQKEKPWSVRQIARYFSVTEAVVYRAINLRGAYAPKGGTMRIEFDNKLAAIVKDMLTVERINPVDQLGAILTHIAPDGTRSRIVLNETNSRQLRDWLSEYVLNKRSPLRRRQR